MTTKAPPSYDGRSSWFAYEDAIDDWCDITELDNEKRGPAIGPKQVTCVYGREASEVHQEELKFLRDRGWSVLRNRSGDIMIGSRTNFVGENMRRLAGSTLVGEATMLFLSPT